MTCRNLRGGEPFDTKICDLDLCAGKLIYTCLTISRRMGHIEPKFKLLSGSSLNLKKQITFTSNSYEIWPQTHFTDVFMVLIVPRLRPDSDIYLNTHSTLNNNIQQRNKKDIFRKKNIFSTNNFHNPNSPPLSHHLYTYPREQLAKPAGVTSHWGM